MNVKVLNAVSSEASRPAAQTGRVLQFPPGVRRSPQPLYCHEHLRCEEVCLCADLTTSLHPKVPLCCHLYQVPNQQRGRLELQELRGAQEAALQPGLGCRGAEAWGPSRRRRLRAWGPDQVVLGLLGMRCPRFDPGDGTQGTKLRVCLFLSLSLSLVVLGLRFLEARGQCALEQSQAPGM